MSKRGNGEGTISKRLKDGKVVGWRGAVVTGMGKDGLPLREWVSGKTREEVAEKMRSLLSDVHRGLVSATPKLTVTEFLDTWLEYKGRDMRKASTMRTYHDSVTRYLKPSLGFHLLAKLRPLDVEQALTAMLTQGKTPAMTAYSLMVLKMALKQAVIWDMVPRNVAQGVRPPKRTPTTFEVWTTEELQTFLASARGHRLYAAFHLAAVTGMRRGEVLGLQWGDLDFERGVVKVQRSLVEVGGQVQLETPKTQNSHRTIFLSQGTMKMLQEHQEQQRVEAAELGSGWQHLGFVFASAVGSATIPSNLDRTYQLLIKKSGVRRIRFHDLRHTAASLMFRQGVSPKVVSTVLGHSDIAFTMRVYTHLYDDQRQTAALDLATLCQDTAPKTA